MDGLGNVYKGSSCFSCWCNPFKRPVAAGAHVRDLARAQMEVHMLSFFSCALDSSLCSNFFAPSSSSSFSSFHRALPFWRRRKGADFS